MIHTDKESQRKLRNKCTLPVLGVLKFLEIFNKDMFMKLMFMEIFNNMEKWLCCSNKEK